MIDLGNMDYKTIMKLSGHKTMSEFEKYSLAFRLQFINNNQPEIDSSNINQNPENIEYNQTEEKLYELINKRVDQMVEEGLIQEVKSLFDKKITELQNNQKFFQWSFLRPM